MDKNIVLDYLDKANIQYKLYLHPACVSVEDSKRIIHIPDTLGCKSLVVKDKKSERYYMVVLPGEKRADMRGLAHYVNAEKFEFATAEKMYELLDVVRGNVSPFCFLYPNSQSVGLIMDKMVLESPLVRFHPCDNTASVVLSNTDLLKYLQLIGKKIIFVD